MRITTCSFRYHRLIVPVVLLGTTGLGCSSTGGPLRLTQEEPKIRTIASIGDRPVGSVTGTPSSSAVADLPTPEPRRDARARVSGRVVDVDGEPVANARVRVADGGIAGGRIIQAKTDRAGGFTLHGLRPGSTYTLIAESEGQGGLVTGRGNVRSPETDVEIALSSDDEPLDRRRASAGGSASSRTISERQAVDDPADDQSRRPRLNPEDLPPAREVESDDESTPARRPVSSSAVSRSGWRRGGTDAPAAIAASSRTTTSSAVDDRSTRRTSVSDDESDEGENPLPPAIEGSGASGAPPGRREEATERPRPSRRVSRVERSKSPGPPPGALALAKDVTPRPMPMAAVTTTPLDPFATVPTPPRAGTTWAALGEAWSSSSLEAPSSEVPAAVESKPPLRSGVARGKTAVPDRGIETCRYDAKNRRIMDFRLPDLQGRAVTFKDFDADLILIDFWGTWCRPCLNSVPHLVELQKRLGPRTLAVVGVACEDGPAPGNAAHVADVAGRLGINYTVLLSNKDGPSPLQEALHVSTFPTMVLVDRQGRIVWRAQDGAPITLARLDKVLDSSTRALSASVDRVRH